MFKKHRKQLIGLIILIFSLTACSNNRDEKIIKIIKPKIQVITISKQSEPVIMEVTGTVKPIKSVIIKALTSGTVTNILSKEGEKVFINQSLAYLFDEKTEIDYFTALNSYNIILNHYNNLSNTNAPLKQTQKNLELSRTNLDLIAINKSRQDIKTPFTGIISHKMIDVNDEVSVGQELFEIFSVNYSKIEISIPTEDAKYLSIGDEVIINNIFKGTLSKIDLVNKKTILEIKYDNKLDLIIGDSVKIKIPLNKLFTKENTYVIPLQSVDLEQNPAIVKIIEDNKIVDRKIEYLQIVNNQIIVNKGLEEGEQIAIENIKSLDKDTEIEVADY
jgi:multidrug efflux pump subunit AcrA (membrane-fusion protein)